MTINIYLDGALTNTSTTNDPVAQGAIVSASAACGAVSMEAYNVISAGGGWIQMFRDAFVHTNLHYVLDRVEAIYTDKGDDPSSVPHNWENTFHSKGPKDNSLPELVEVSHFWNIYGGGPPADPDISYSCTVDAYFISLHHVPTHLPVRTTAGPLLRDATSGKIFRDEVELPVPNG